MPDGSPRKLPTIPTGVPGLDDILRGGFPQGRLSLLEGDPGTGKTTIALQFALEGVRRGEKTLYVTLTETADELHAVAASHGWSLDGVHIQELSSGGESIDPEAQYTILHPGEVELGGIAKAVFEEAKRIAPTRVVVDSVTEMRLLARDAVRSRRQILAIKRFFGELHATLLVLDDLAAHPDDHQLHSLAQAVVRLEHVAGDDYGRGGRGLRVTKVRGIAFREGFHGLRIATGGIIVIPRLVAAEHDTAFEPGQVASGISELDAMLCGGLDRGTVALFMGPAGSGKSVLAMHYALGAARRGERADIFLFEEGSQTFRARAVGLGMDPQAYVEKDLIALHQVDPGDLTISEFVHAVRETVERHHARVVVIDSVNGYLTAMRDERVLALYLRELIKYLSQRGVLTLLVVTEHGLVGGGLAAPVNVSYLADTVLVLRYFETAGEVRRAIAAVKRRSGPHARTIHELQIAAPITVGGPLADFEGVLAGSVRTSRHPVEHADDE